MYVVRSKNVPMFRTLNYNEFDSICLLRNDSSFLWLFNGKHPHFCLKNLFGETILWADAIKKAMLQAFKAHCRKVWKRPHMSCFLVWDSTIHRQTERLWKCSYENQMASYLLFSSQPETPEFTIHCISSNVNGVSMTSCSPHLCMEATFRFASNN